MPAKFQPALARKVEAAEDHLVIVTRDERCEIPWAQCSEKLAAATFDERRHVRLSPGGYGLHWPLLDEDLAVGPLVDAAV